MKEQIIETRNDIQKSLQELNTFIDNNLTQCCIELLEWRSTGILCNGKIREAATMFPGKMIDVNKLVLVERQVGYAAMNVLIEMGYQSK